MPSNSEQPNTDSFHSAAPLAEAACGDKAVEGQQKPLTARQTELLDAMRAGTICHYMRYAGRFNPHPYYFRTDTMKRCTTQVAALLEKGYAEKVSNGRFGEHHVRAKQTKGQA